MKPKIYLAIVVMTVLSQFCQAQQNIFPYCKNTPLHFGKGFLINNPWQGSYDLFSTFQTDSTNQAGSAQITYTIVQNSAQLRTSLNQNDYLSVSYLGNSLNASYGVSSNSYSNSSSITYAITGSIDYGTVNLKNPVLSSAAKNDTITHNWTDFVTRFGDNYVDQISLGVSFTVFITLQTASSSLQSQVNASVAANGGYGPLSGSASASFSSAVQSASSSSNLTIQIVSNGVDISSLSNLVQTACSYTNSIDSVTSAITACMKTFNIKNSLITSFHYTPMSTLGINVSNNLFQAAKISKLMKLYDHYFDIEAKSTLLNSIKNSKYYKDFHNNSDALEAARLLQQYNSAMSILATAHNVCITNPCPDLSTCCNDPVFNFNYAFINKFINLPFSDCINNNSTYSLQYANNTFTYTSISDQTFLLNQSFFNCSSTNYSLIGKIVKTNFSCLVWNSGYQSGPGYVPYDIAFFETMKHYFNTNIGYGAYIAGNCAISGSNTDSVDTDGLISVGVVFNHITANNPNLVVRQGAKMEFVILNPSPAIDAIITPSDTTICQGSSVILNANTDTGLTYKWQLNGINISGAVNSSYIATAGGNYTVVVTETATGRSTTSYWSNITVNQPPATPIISGSASFCANSTDTLSANSAGCVGCSYTWSPSNQVSPTYIVSSAGTYTVTAANGCTPDATSQPKTLTVTQPPVATISVLAGNILKANLIIGATYQWFNGTKAIKGETSLTYNFNSTGDYYVGITDAKGCTGYSKDTLLYTGINEHSLSQQINIYPNPANNKIFIQTSFFRINETLTISVLDMIGKIVQQENIKFNDEFNVDIKNLPAGVYFLSLKSENANVVKKFVKE